MTNKILEAAQAAALLGACFISPDNSLVEIYDAVPLCSEDHLMARGILVTSYLDFEGIYCFDLAEAGQCTNPWYALDYMTIYPIEIPDNSLPFELWPRFGGTGYVRSS